MKAAEKRYEVDSKTEGAPPRTDATFTEIYERILYNQSLVKSELRVLMQLVQKKLMEKVGTPPAAPRVICGGSVKDGCDDKNSAGFHSI